MAGRSLAARLALGAGVVCAVVGVAVADEPMTAGEAIVIRLVRPDRQASEVLRLFEGARWSDPAAALAAWKRRTPEPGLGKPAEALIAMFNPEMAREWRAWDGAEIRVGTDPASGELGWSAVIPRDDGSLAAAITAMRLTYPDDPPLPVDGIERPVARLGRSGVPLAYQFGPAIVVASARGWLEQGVAIARGGAHPVTDRRGLPPDRDSGTTFLLEPERLFALQGGPLWQRRAIEALRAWGFRRVEGTAALDDGTLRVEVTSTFERGRAAGTGRRAVEAGWLEAVPSNRVMAAFSMAIRPDDWDEAFAAADRVERVDPARAGLAPLRTRLNLLALGIGWKLEADVRPHLRGLSAALLGQPSRPGQTTGALIGLHLDEPAVARDLERGAEPRLGALAVRARGRDLWIGWGDGARAIPGESPPLGPTLAASCGGWVAEGRGAPSRVAAIWPGRLGRPAGLSGEAARALAEDPPVVWWGWDEAGRSRELVRWTGLRARVRRLLEAPPFDGGPAASIPDSRLKTE